jgi:V/A-type H+-transporting ATPase subunit I
VVFISRLPKIAAFSQLGWLSILWGMYFLVRLIVLENGDFGNLQSWVPGPYLLAAGLGLIIVFDEQKGSFFKGLGLGLAKLPLKLLDSISSFSDIISYVRLFAVGLASLEVAKAFNAMADNMGFNMPAGLGAAFILFFGHTLNIVMGVLSLMVHGVRLNMLEFSGHLGMEWAGIAYKPFQNQIKE